MTPNTLNNYRLKNPSRRGPGGDMRHGDTHSLADSVMDTTRPVKLKDFAEHYRLMSADSDFR